MINLLQGDIDIANAKEDHWNFFRLYVKIRVFGVSVIPKNATDNNLPQKKYTLKSNQKALIESLASDAKLMDIICGSPATLIKCHKALEEKMSKLTLEQQGKLKVDLEHIFNYKNFTGLELEKGYSPYQLTTTLDVRSCTYCNRTYTVTRTSSSKGKLMRPQLDHWFPKSKYPLLAVSFYNLIPCCNTCNGPAKGDIDLKLNKHIHPYVLERHNDDINFDYFYSRTLSDYRVFIKKSYSATGKGHRTVKKLKIDEMYNAHTPELEDLLNIRKAYGEQYIKKMGTFFPKTGLSEEEVYRLLFGVELNEKNYHKRPMSKFKHDILKELGIIK